MSGRRLYLVDGREYDLRSPLAELRGFLFDREALNFSRQGVTIALDEVEAVRESMTPSNGRRREWLPLEDCYLARREPPGEGRRRGPAPPAKRGLAARVFATTG